MGYLWGIQCNIVVVILGTATIFIFYTIKYNDSVTVSTSGTAVGTAYRPVYVNSSGVATQCTVSDSTSAAAIATNANLTTERDVYYGLPTINGSHAYTSSTSIYAPTSVGTSGYVLSSSGSGAPSWVAQSTLSVGSATTLGTDTVGSSSKPIYLSSGTPTAHSATRGGTARPIYQSSGALTACSATVGSSTIPVYMSSGTITSTGCDLSKTLRLRSYTFSTSNTSSVSNSYNVDRYSLVFIYANAVYSALLWIIDSDTFYVIQCGFSSTTIATTASTASYQNMGFTISDSVLVVSVGSGTTLTFNIVIYCFSDD